MNLDKATYYRRQERLHMQRMGWMPEQIYLWNHCVSSLNRHASQWAKGDWKKTHGIWELGKLAYLCGRESSAIVVGQTLLPYCARCLITDGAVLAKSWGMYRRSPIWDMEMEADTEVAGHFQRNMPNLKDGPESMALLWTLGASAWTQCNFTGVAPVYRVLEWKERYGCSDGRLGNEAVDKYGSRVIYIEFDFHGCAESGTVRVLETHGDEATRLVKKYQLSDADTYEKRQTAQALIQMEYESTNIEPTVPSPTAAPLSASESS